MLAFRNFRRPRKGQEQTSIVAVGQTTKTTLPGDHPISGDRMGNWLITKEYEEGVLRIMNIFPDHVVPTFGHIELLDLDDHHMIVNIAGIDTTLARFVGQRVQHGEEVLIDQIDHVAIFFDNNTPKFVEFYPAQGRNVLRVYINGTASLPHRPTLHFSELTFC